MNGIIQKRIGLTGLALGLLVLAWSAVAIAKGPASPTGTFSSMYYNEESTDLVGMEIRIVVGRDGYQGTIQYARGEPTDLILFKPVIDDSNHIAFSFASPWTGERVAISGRITEPGLEMGEQPGENLLKRAPSYWDVRRDSPP
jgi:hypothetical protein